MLPDVRVQKWGLTLPFAICGVYSVKSELHGPVNRMFVEEIARHYGHDVKTRHSGAVSFLQRFGPPNPPRALSRARARRGRCRAGR
ncbi:unnamed protein product [Laminaria digitata]